MNKEQIDSIFVMMEFENINFKKYNNYIFLKELKDIKNLFYKDNNKIEHNENIFKFTICTIDGSEYDIISYETEFYYAYRVTIYIKQRLNGLKYKIKIDDVGDIFINGKFCC